MNHEHELLIDHQQLVHHLPDVPLVFGPVINTSTRKLGMAGWNLHFKQRELLIGSVKYTRPKVCFFDPNNRSNSLTVRVIHGHTTLIDDVSKLWDALTNRAVVGNVSSDYRALTTKASNQWIDDEVKTLQKRLAFKAEEIAELKISIGMAVESASLAYRESLDEAATVKKYNDQRIANLDEETIRRLAEESELKVVRLVIDNEVETLLKELAA